MSSTAEDARRVCELVGGKLLEEETALGTVPVTGFPSWPVGVPCQAVLLMFTHLSYRRHKTQLR